MKKLDLKKILINIIGSQASNEEIEMFMTYIDNFSKAETEQRKTVQPDIANEAHIKTRVDPVRII